MSDSTLYIAVFMFVFGGFLLIQMILEVHEERKHIDKPKNIPFLFRLAYVPITLISSMLGKTLVNMFPDASRKMEAEIRAADLSIDVSFVYAGQVFYGFLALFLVSAYVFFTSLPFSLKLFVGVMAFFMGCIPPATRVQNMAKERREELIRGLPYSIDLMTSAMRSGLDFGAALQYYVNLGLDSPLTKEFGRVLEETRLGETREHALEAMAERMQVSEFTTVVVAVIHGMEVGASISDALALQCEELRRARFSIAEQKAARAPSVMLFPMILLIVPAVIIIMGTPVFLKLMETGLLDRFVGR